MKNLKIYYIDEGYINYLRQFDKNVAYNKNTTRPYIGIVYTYNNHNYFAPLSSPKPKHKDINSKAIDIYKIKNGELGVVNINNMIPTPIEELTEVLPTITDIKYKKMLEEQLTFLNNHKADLFKKISHFQNMFRKGHLSEKILERCCDFILLEEKMEQYIKMS
jgi:protein AbiQ